MEPAVMLAKVFGPCLAIIGLWMLLYADNLLKTLNAMKNSPSSLYITAVLTILIGLLIITNYNSWRIDIFLFVTLLGWVFFIRGLVGLFLPQVLVKLFLDKKPWTKVMGVVPLIWGLLLIWAGFYR